MSREQIGTVRITRTRLYKLDPWTPRMDNGAEVIVEPGDYPVYRDGLSHYWRMTGVINHASFRMGDGLFVLHEGPGNAVPSDDDVVFYSLRYGPDEWAELVSGFESDSNPALVFALTEPANGELT